MPKKKGGKKDSITGMRIGNGLTILSDTVYAEDSPEMRRIYGENNFTYETGGKTEIEFEFSKKFIIITSNTTGQLTGNDGIPQTTPDYTIRVAGKGKFKAGKDGILKKGKIKESSKWTFAPGQPGTETNAGSEAMDTIIAFKNQNTFTSQDTEINPRKIILALTTPPASYEYMSNIQSSLADEYNTLKEFQTFKTSRHFKEDWHQNPFSSDLI